MISGYIYLSRKLMSYPFYRDSEYVHLWVHLLMSASYTERRIKIDNSDKFITLLPGQLWTSRPRLAEQTGIEQSKVERILKAFQNEQLIEQQASNKYRIISVNDYARAAKGELENEQQMNSKRTAKEQQMNTYNKVKKGKAGKKEEKEPKNFPPEALRLSCLLADLILQRTPGNSDLLPAKRPATLTLWADNVTKINHLDQRAWEEIEAVICWCQADEFWAPIILSGAKLREKYNQLSAKMEATKLRTTAGATKGKGAISPEDQNHDVIRRYMEARNDRINLCPGDGALGIGFQAIN